MKLTKHIHSSKINAVRQTDSRLWGLIAILAVATSLTSCVKDKLYNTPHPDKATVVITTDWADALDETDVPAAYHIGMDDGEAVKTQEATTVYPDLLIPGKHSVFAYNEPQGMTISGTTASVNLRTDGTLEPMPDYLFSAVKEFEAQADDTVHVSVPMVRRLCPITLNLTLTGENVSEIVGIEATLGGIVQTVNLQSRTLGTENRSVMLNVQQTGAEVKLQCRVPGISPNEKQQLTVTLTMADGHMFTITSDLSEELADLNAEREIVLNCTVQAPQDGHFSGTITDWMDGGSHDIEAN